MTVPTVERHVCLRRSVQLWHIQSLRGLVQQSGLGMKHLVQGLHIVSRISETLHWVVKSLLTAMFLFNTSTLLKSVRRGLLGGSDSRS